MIERSDVHQIPFVGSGRILLMDDDEQLKNTTGRMLKKIGYETIFAEDGAEAIKLYKIAREAGQPFDAVILDLTVPGRMGGKVTIKKFIEIDPEVKAIISSGEINHLVMEDFHQYGFSGVLPKPYNMKQLKSALDEVILEVGEIGELTVLIATRDGHFKERVLEVLDKKGYSSVVVDNCKKALLKVLDNSFDLILFDPDLEEIDGVDSIEIIKKIQPSLPIIVTSDESTYETDVKIAKVGVHIMDKPLVEQSSEELFASVEKIVNRS